MLSASCWGGGGVRRVEKQGQSRKGANLYTVDFAKVGRSPLFFSPHQSSSLLPPRFLYMPLDAKFCLLGFVLSVLQANHLLLPPFGNTDPLPLPSHQHPNKQQTAVLLNGYHCAPVNVLSICLACTRSLVDGQQGDKQPSSLTSTPMDNFELPTRLRGADCQRENKQRQGEQAIFTHNRSWSVTRGHLATRCTTMQPITQPHSVNSILPGVGEVFSSSLEFVSR